MQPLLLMKTLLAAPPRWTNNATSFICRRPSVGRVNLFGAGVITEKTFALSGNQTSLDISLDFGRVTHGTAKNSSSKLMATLYLPFQPRVASGRTVLS